MNTDYIDLAIAFLQAESRNADAARAVAFDHVIDMLRSLSKIVNAASATEDARDFTMFVQNLCKLA